MRILFFLFFLVMFSMPALKSQDYFQQKVDYQLTAALDTAGPDLAVSGRMVYRNNSGDSLDHLIIHIWMNCFDHPYSDWSQQALETGNRDFQFARDKRGGYRQLKFMQGGRELSYEFYEEQGRFYVDIIRLELYTPLAPHSATEIELDYRLRIPWAFDRPGYRDDLYRMTQWYPKPAVYDRDGWHPIPYLSLGEFYAEFGDYKVSMILPLSFSAVATGIENDEESELLLPDRQRKLVYEASNVHDFAWFTSESYIPYRESVEIEGRMIPIHLFVKEDFSQIDKIFDFTRRALQFLSEKIVVYPYPQVSLVQESSAGSGGMEYPMLTILDMDASDRRTDHLIAHELAHQWFYSILASNERDEPWIDEGFASYYDQSYDAAFYGRHSGSGAYSELPGFIRENQRDFMDHAVMHLFRTNFILPVGKSSTSCDAFNYLASNYARMATGLEYLEAYMGEALFQKGIKRLFKLWSYRHPKTSDLKAVMESVLGESLDWFFVDYLLSGKAPDFAIRMHLDEDRSVNVDLERHGLERFPVRLSAFDSNNALTMSSWVRSNGMTSQTLAMPPGEYSRIELNKGLEIYDDNLLNNSTEKKPVFPALRMNNLLENPSRTTVGLVPALFYNRYDGLMIGPAFYGPVFPQQKFRYMLSPVYAFGSSEFTGFGALQRDFLIRPGRNMRKISVALSGKRFNYNELSEPAEFLAYWKMSPSISLHLKKGLLRFSSLEYRWMYVRQEGQGFNETQVSQKSFNAHQLKLRMYRARGLSVTESSLQLQYERYDNIFNSNTESYLRINATLDRQYYYNSQSRVFIRLFSSWFPHNSKRASSSFASIFTRGSVGISGQAFTDQFYEDLYFARSSQNARQISIRDGGFKTAFGPAFNIGLTNDFMASANIKIDLPFHLPANFRIRPYFDYAAVKTRQLTVDPVKVVHFYSGGLALELGELFGLYFPLVNSSELSAGYQEKGVFNRMSFSLRLQSLNPWQKGDQPGRFLIF